MIQLFNKGLGFIKRNVNNALTTLNRQFNFTSYSLPDFLIIGAQKSGTTALYSYLIQHPGIIPAKTKEIFYFGNPHNLNKGKKWYSSHFCTVLYKQKLSKKIGYMPITGESTPDMHMPFYPGFAHELLPSVKLIAILRDPVDRAYSQYQHNRRNGGENRSFEDALAGSPLNFAPEVINDAWAYHNSSYSSYITRGLYAEALKRWYKYYSQDSIHIINSNNMFSDPHTELVKVLQFLAMPDFKFNDISSGATHKGNYETKMSDQVKEYLVTVYRPHNKKLSHLIGRDFGWPS